VKLKSNTIAGASAFLGLTLIAAMGTAATLVEEAPGAVIQLEQSVKLIERLDRKFNAVTELNQAAMNAAKQLDANDLGRLGGMPILVKDNIDVTGMATTAGSLALSDNFPAQSAPIIRQLEADGAVILGKANLSEWANFRSEKSSSGWSAVGGQTNNAFDVTRTPCGSSAGSGVAVALGYVPVAIGTETNGSIVCPASINGVVGFKPTHGLVSGEGIVPLALTQDTAGPIANSIDNAALVLASMIDAQQENTQVIIDGLRDFDQGPNLKGMRIGVMASTLGFDVRRDQILQAAIAKLEATGVEIVPDLNLEAPEGFGGDAYQILLYEFKRDLNSYFANRNYSDANNSLKTMTLEALIDFNQANAEQELKHFDQGIFEKSQALTVSEKEYQEMLEKVKQVTREQGLDRLFKEHKIDAIIGITVGPAWKIDHVNGDSFFGPGSSTYPAIGGHPHITFPDGEIAGLPVGVSFIGQRYLDHKLAQIVFKYSRLEK